MSNSTPEIPGYQFDQRILLHPLAELWHGRAFTGADVIALVLSDEGARSQVVLDRLAGGAATDAGRPPLWAADLSVPRPYAITQLVHGGSGAEHLVDPLDGVLGDDRESLDAVREQLVGFGATPPALLPADTARRSTPAYRDPQPAAPTYADPRNDIPAYTEHPDPEPAVTPAATPAQPPSKIEIARQYRRKIGGWVYGVVAVVVLLVFTVAYSVGTAIGGAVKDKASDAAPPPAVSPEPIASPVLLSPIERATTAAYKRPTGAAGVFGATYAANADVQVVTNAELPFAVGWPRPPQVAPMGESSQAILRRIVTENPYAPGGLKNSMQAQIAVHPCDSLADCLADRPAFDKVWTAAFKTAAPATAKDNRTWLTVSAKTPYTITMTRAFSSGGRWWLVGAMVYGPPEEASQIQRVVNDIWWQTS